MGGRRGTRPTWGLVAIVVVVAAAAALVPGAVAGIASGALNCTLPKYNPTHYAIQTGQTVTCTIDGASDASGKTTVPVIIKSSDLGNTTVTGTVSGTGSSTKITFTYTAPVVACNTTIVAYISNGNNSNNSKITAGGTAAAGFAFVDASGKGITTCTPPPPNPLIYLGYADTYRPTGGTPSPWLGSPNVTFIGCGVDPNGAVPTTDNCAKQPVGGADIYDSSAIRIDNVTGSPMSVTGASVSMAPACNFNPWPGLNVTIPVGGTLILTQTGGVDPCGVEPFGYNFDGSDTNESSCVNSGIIPVITLTINGTTSTINDTGQILNTGGIEPVTCSGATSEMRNWVQIAFP